MGRDPADVARAVLEAVRRRSKDVLLAGLLATVALYLRTLCPALFFKVMAIRARKEQRPEAAGGGGAGGGGAGGKT